MLLGFCGLAIVADRRGPAPLATQREQTRRRTARRPAGRLSRDDLRGRRRRPAGLAASTRPRRRVLVSWAGAISLLVLVVWLVPIKNYRLPVALPFSLELYRLLMILFVGAWIVAIVTGTRGVAAGGLGKPIALLAAVGLLSILANARALSNAGLETQAIKSLSYFLSFLARLPARPLDDRQPRRRSSSWCTRSCSARCAIAFAAFYEARTHYDVFDHLHNWFPFLEPTRAIKESRAAAAAGCASAPRRSTRSRSAPR